MKQVFFSEIYLFLAILFSICLSAMQVIPTLELVGQSVRSQGVSITDAMRIIYPKDGFLTFLGIGRNTIDQIQQVTRWGLSYTEIKSPYSYYSYVGLLPLGFFFLGVYAVFRQATSRWLFFLFCFALLMTLGAATPLFPTIWSIVPGMQYFRYSIRFLSFTTFFGLLLSGYGYNYFISKFGNNKNMQQIFIIFIIGFTIYDLFIHQYSFHPVRDVKNWIAKPSIALEKIKENTFPNYRVQEVKFVFFDFVHESEWPVQDVFTQFLPANFNTVIGIPTTYANMTLPLRRIEDIQRNNLSQFIITHEYQLQKAQKQTDIPLEVSDNLLNSLYIQGVRYLTTPFPLTNRQFVLVKKFSFPQRITEDLPIVVGTRIKRISLHITYGYIYEIKDALPRAFFVSRAAKVKNDHMLTFITSELFDPQKEILLDQESTPNTHAEENSIQITKDTGDTIAFTANAKSNGWIYLADSYYPGWVASVDGKVTPLYKANYAFRAIQINSGKHQVIFVYQPLSRTTGYIISGVFFLGTGIVLFCLFAKLLYNYRIPSVK